jgi:UDP-N-acetylglucosamine transferase subunit ALG13
MKVADLIISHCGNNKVFIMIDCVNFNTGSGTLLECLQNNKKVCAVVNETLMHNH